MTTRTVLKDGTVCVFTRSRGPGRPSKKLKEMQARAAHARAVRAKYKHALRFVCLMGAKI